MKASKKATVAIVSLVQAIDPTRSKLISFDEAWEIISEYAGLEGSLTTSVRNGTTNFTIYKIKGTEREQMDNIQFSTNEVFEEGDWDWTTIFKTVIEHLMKTKLVKKPRSKKQSLTDTNKCAIKRTKTEQISQISSKVTKSTPSKKNVVKSQENELKDLKRKKTSLYGRIYDWKKKGKDATKLEKEYKELCEQIKKMK